MRSVRELDRLADLIADELVRQIGGVRPSYGRATGTVVCEACGEGCDGSHCVAHGPERVGRLLACGAERVSAGPGVGACDNVLARMIDHTLLVPTATREQVRALCEEAAVNCFATVCVNPWWVRLAVRNLAATPVRVCTVIGFPLGANRSETKVYEAARAIDDGATELDMVLNIGALKSGAYTDAERDIAGVVRAGEGRAHVKVILETAYLSDEEKVKGCVLAQAAGAHFVKTSTGFGPGGATADDIRLMRRVVGGKLGVKASGGVKDQPTAIRMIEAGATRIGASAGVKIVRGNGAAPGGSAVTDEATPYGAPTTSVIPAPRATIHRLR